VSNRSKLKLTVRQIDIAGIVVCLLLTALAYVLVLRPVARDRATLAALRGDIGSTERAKASIETSQLRLESDLAAVRGEVEASPVKLAPATKLNLRLARIERSAQESGLLIDETRSSAVVMGERYDTVPIEVSGRGSYPDCARFLHRLQRDLPDVEVLGFELSASPDEARARPTFRFDLAWYAAPAVATAPGGRAP
jgi:Tfp pilus assembly protein PilO